MGSSNSVTAYTASSASTISARSVSSIRGREGPFMRHLAELCSVQDWFLRYHLQAVPGVAEVAPLGGFVQ